MQNYFGYELYRIWCFEQLHVSSQKIYTNQYKFRVCVTIEKNVVICISNQNFYGKHINYIIRCRPTCTPTKTRLEQGGGVPLKIKIGVLLNVDQSMMKS